MKNILITGPSLSANVKGGQITHLKTILNTYESDGAYNLLMFSTSSAQGNSENSVLKVMLFLYRLICFPFQLRNVDLVHVNSTFDNKAGLRDCLLLIWAKQFGVPYILQFHGGVLEDFSLLKKRWFKKLWLPYLKASKACLVLKKEHQAYLESAVEHNVLLSKNYVPVPEQSHQNTEGFSFIFMGQLLKEKGIYEILDAAKKLSNRVDFAIHICGTGPEMDHFRESVQTYDMAKVINIHGAVGGLEKDEIFRSACCFLLPSYAEGLPYALLEAMSYGLAPICTPVGTIPNLVKNNHNGILVNTKSVSELYEAMLKVLNRQQHCREMGVKARNLICREYSVRQMKSFYSQLWAANVKS